PRPEGCCIREEGQGRRPRTGKSGSLVDLGAGGSGLPSDEGRFWWCGNGLAPAGGDEDASGRVSPLRPLLPPPRSIEAPVHRRRARGFALCRGERGRIASRDEAGASNPV